MNTVRIDLTRLRTQREALKRFEQLSGMPENYTGELEELHELLCQWQEPVKIEMVIGGNLGPFSALMEMLEDARMANDRLLFVVIMNMQ